MSGDHEVRAVACESAGGGADRAQASQSGVGPAERPCRLEATEAPARRSLADERDGCGAVGTSGWRERQAKPVWALRAATGLGGGCTDYDYVVHGLPAPRVPDTDGRRAPRQVGVLPPPAKHHFVALKRFPARALDRGQLAAFLEQEGPLGRALLEDFRALRSVQRFESRYVDSQRLRAAPPPTVKRTRMPRHLWDELLAKGATVPIAGPRRDGTEVRYTAAARPIPDRKDPSLARMIFPCLQLNDVMVAPRATPTPHIHRFIHAVVRRRWMRTCDFVGFFWTCEVHPTVGRRYFAMARGKEWVATVRGLLGWNQMPALMGTLTQLIAARAAREASPGRAARWEVPRWLEAPSVPVCVAARRRAVCGSVAVPDGAGAVETPVCIDNITAVGDDRGEVERTVERVKTIAGRLGLEVHDLSQTAQGGVALGVEFRLGDDAGWRVARPWAERWIAAADEADRRDELALRDFWRLVGGAIWVCFAEMYPFTWLGGIVEALKGYARRWAIGALQLSSPIAYVGGARAAVRAVASALQAGAWRRMAIGVGRPVFSDASVEGGWSAWGAVAPGVGGYVVVASGRTRDARHINLQESAAASWAHALAVPQPGLSVPRVVDSVVAAFRLRRGYAADPAADAAIRRSYELAAARGEGWGPVLWVPSAAQPADDPSRCSVAAEWRMPEAQAKAAYARAVRLGYGFAAVAALPAGWRRGASASASS